MFIIDQGKRVIQDQILESFGLHAGQIIKFEDLWNHLSERGFLEYSYGLGDVYMLPECKAVKRIETDMVTPEVKKLFDIKYPEGIEKNIGKPWKISDKVTFEMSNQCDVITIHAHRLRKDGKTWYAVPNNMFNFRFNAKYETPDPE